MRNFIQRLSLLLAMLALTACGTLRTLAPTDDKINIGYKDKRSYCQSIPRTYSGVAHNFCMMYGEPDRTSFNTATEFPAWAIDTMLCAVTDTLALPYTLSRQLKDGSIRVVR